MDNLYKPHPSSRDSRMSVCILKWLLCMCLFGKTQRVGLGILLVCGCVWAQSDGDRSAQMLGLSHLVLIFRNAHRVMTAQGATMTS